MTYRLHATITYRADSALRDVVQDLDKLGERERKIIIEYPRLDAIVEIKINRIGHTSSPTLTVEQALKL